MTFKKCCDDCMNVEYNLLHNPRPIELSTSLESVVKNLQWYIPNIKSYQSIENEFITNKSYDDLVFDFIKSKMGLSDEDVLLTNTNLENDLIEFYSERCCVNCQKIILKTTSTNTKTSDFLRHIRNIIAHGRFTIINDLLIGFDKTSDEPNGKTTAIIKIDPKSLLIAIEDIMHPRFNEYVFAYAFSKLGYSIEKSSANARIFADLLISKEDKKYAVEIKSYSKMIYVPHSQIQRYVNNSRKIEGHIKVLFIDTSRLRKESKQLLKDNDILYFDKSLVDDLVKGIDILSRDQ